MTNTALFREVQRWRDVWWVMALVFGQATLQWWIFFTQIVRGTPVGNNPGSNEFILVFWFIFGVCFPAFFFWLHMVVEVIPGKVIIRYRPFIERQIPIEEIAHIEPRAYRPLREFGGWGIRGWNGRVAYNVTGNTGVELTLINGQRVLIGTQRAGEMASAIYKIWSSPR